ncbi:hypothetical protein G6F56_011056 [Rhizopus delemar]|nr:hypothetical protein G6F56_011056 [Rhizopus delemar]
MQNFQSDKSFGDFTRRKNWSQSILDSIRDVLHVLSNDLHIIYSSDASSQILGYRPSELVGHSFLEFLHMDDVDFFLRDFKQIQNTSQTVRISYRFRRKDGNYATLETRGQFHKSYFFGNARRLPTETSRSIDSILDLKMENELLKRQLEALQRTDQNLEFEQTANESLVYTQGVDPSFDVAESLSLFTGLNYDMGERSYGISSGLVGGELKSIETLQKSKKVCMFYVV